MNTLNRSMKCIIALSLIVFASGTGQTRLDEIFSPSDLPFLRDGRLVHVGSYDTAGHNNDFISIAAGNSATIMDVRGPGAIARIWMTVGSPDPYYLRRILIRMYWDGETTPSVEAPLGDFFGTGFGYKQYVSRFVGMTSGGFISYFPMPFNKSARIEIVNETGQTISSFYYNIDYLKVDQPFSGDIGYFHAWWNRDIRTTSKENYLILMAKGRGQFVGCNLSIQGYGNNLYFLEGDEMIYVDGETRPSINGTGTEDFFNSGWYFDRGEYSAPYHGLIWKVDSLSRIAAYRFMVGDAVPFYKSIRVTIEHGTENSQVADYSSTAYWYQLEPHDEFPPILKSSLRIPLRVQVPGGAIEAESLQPISTNTRSEIQDMTDFGPDWSGGKELKVDCVKAGDSFTLNIPVSEADRYRVDVYYTKGPDYGDADIVVNGRKVGVIAGYSKTALPGGGLQISDLVSDGRPINVKFVVTGKDRASAGNCVGLDAFVVSSEKEFITNWKVAGPFPNPSDNEGKRIGLDTQYPPENGKGESASFTGSGGKKIKWQRVTAASDGFVNLLGRFSPDELVVAYASSEIYSPGDQTLPLMIGSDDGAKVFINGRQVFRILEDRGAEPDQDTVSVKLKRGWNRLLMKVENNLGGYGFYARFVDGKRELKYRIGR